MRRVRRGFHGLGRLALAAIVAIGAALWTWTAPGAPGRLAAPHDPGVDILILDNGFHTDLALPRAALEVGNGPLARAVRTLPPGDWVLVGWGDARFYIDTAPIASRLPDGARAFLRPGGNPSVLMLYPRAGEPGAGFPPESRRRLRLSFQGMEALRAGIEATLRLDDGQVRLEAQRPGDPARFYAAHGRFWIGNLCNHWTARMLNVAGLPVRPARSLTSAEIVAAIDRTDQDRVELDQG